MATRDDIDVKSWLLARVKQIIDVCIIQKTRDEEPERVIWKGQGTVIRCVREGVVLALRRDGETWWSRLWRDVFVRHVVPRSSQQSLSVPYEDLSVNRDSTTGAECLVIDAATWQRSPQEL